MRKRVLLSIIAWCCHFTLSYAGTAAAYDDYREKIVQEGVAALNRLIRENRLHTQNGESYKNKYVLVLEGNAKYIEQQNVVVGKLRYNPLLDDTQEASINQRLQLINAKKDFGVYVLVFNSWVIDLKKEIPANASLKDVMALKPYTNEDIKTKVWKDVERLGQEIMLKSEMASFSAQIGIVYGREICYLGKGIHKVYATTEAYASGLGEGVLASINNSLKGKLPPISKTFDYLNTFPQELYNAYLKRKDIKVNIKLQYKFAPKPGSYFDNFQKKLGANKKDGATDPAPNAPNELVFDYTSTLSPEEKAELYSKLGFISRESKLYKTKLYLTDYQNPPQILTTVKEYIDNPDSKDIILWVHINEKREMELMTAYGKDVPNQGDANSFVRFLASILPDVPPLEFNPFTAMLDGLATMINALEIPERFYNPKHLDMTTGKPDYNPLFYRVYQVSSVISLNPVMLASFQKVGEFTPPQLEFAAVCGFWNGLVRMVSSLPTFVSWGTKMILNENNARQDFMDAMSSMYNKCAQDHFEIMIHLPGFQEVGAAKCAWDLISNHFTEGNACVIAAKAGSAIFDVLSLVIAIGDVAKFGKIAEIVNLLDPIYLLMKGTGVFIRSVVLPAGKIAYICGKGAISFVLKGTRYSIELMEKVGESYRIISDIDWSRVISWAEVVDQYGNKYRVGLLMSADELTNAGLKIKKVLADAKGKEFTDDLGRKLAVVGKEGDEGSNMLAVVDDAANALENLIKRLSGRLKNKSLSSALEAELRSDAAFRKLLEENEEFIEAWEILSGTPYRKGEKYLRYVDNLSKEAKLGRATSFDYRDNFFKEFPELVASDYVVHHAIERQVLKNYPNLFTEAELHSLENLRGIPKTINSDVHLSKIRVEWNKFYSSTPNPTRQQFLQKAKEIDDMFGSQFYPPIR